jgi:hypothetical protein
VKKDEQFFKAFYLCGRYILEVVTNIEEERADDTFENVSVGLTNPADLNHV